MSIDLCACRRIIENEGLLEARKLGLVDDLFIGEGLTAYKFICEHAKNHGVVPQLATVKNDVSVDLSIPAPEPLSYYARKLFERKNLEIAHHHTGRMVGCIQNHDASGSLAEARSIIAECLKWQFGKKSYVDPRLTVDDRVREQLELESLHGTIDGLRTPWPELDLVTRGLHGGELWVLIALKKVGKTWGEILFFRELLKQDARPLLVTMEMTSKKIVRRFDALYSALSFGELRSGLLGYDGMQRYIDELRRMTQEHEFFIAGDGLVKTPADVEILVQDLKPGAVMIDGVYLMEPSHRRWTSKYEKVSTVIDEFQPMTHRINLPIFVSTQFNRSLKEGSLTGDSGKAGYAFEIMQNCLTKDTIVSMQLGLATIGSIADSGTIELWNGERCVPARVIKSGLKAVCEVNLDNGETIRASEDHRFLMLANGRTKWKRVGDLSSGDVLCRSRPFLAEHKPGDGEATDHSCTTHGRTISLPGNVDGDIALLLGILTGNGYVADEKYWSISMNAYARDVIDISSEILSRKFGVSFSKICRNKNTLDARLACRELARHMYSVYGLTKGIAHQKAIPSGVLKNTPDVWRAFLRGLFETDGHVAVQSGHVMLTSVSSVLAHQSAMLLECLGISCSVFPMRTSRLGRHQPYRVLIANPGIDDFHEKIGFIGSHKKNQLSVAMGKTRRKKWSIHRNPMIATVVEVVHTSNMEDMYDIVTESEEKIFWANGILAHNCDICIAMFRDNDFRAANQMLWSILEHREGEDFSWITNWNLEQMDFSFVNQVNIEDLIKDNADKKSSKSGVKF